MIVCTCGCEFFQSGMFQHGNGDLIGSPLSRMDCAECGKRWMVQRDGTDEKKIPFPSIEAAKLLRKHYDAQRKAQEEKPKYTFANATNLVYTNGTIIGTNGTIIGKP